MNRPIFPLHACGICLNHKLTVNMLAKLSLDGMACASSAAPWPWPLAVTIERTSVHDGVCIDPAHESHMIGASAKHALGAKGKAKFSPHGEAVNGTNHAEKGKGFCLPHKHADSTKKARFRRELATPFAARCVVSYRADGHVQLCLLPVRRHSNRTPAGPSAGRLGPSTKLARLRKGALLRPSRQW